MAVLPTRFTHVKHLMVVCGVAFVASQRRRNTKHEQVFVSLESNAENANEDGQCAGCSGRLIRLFTLFTPLTVEFNEISRECRR